MGRCPACGADGGTGSGDGSATCVHCGAALEAATESLPVLEGELLAGKFSVVRELGRGEFGHVFLAKDTILHRDVAIKTIRTAAFRSARERESFERRFLREARAVASLSHPHIITVHEAGQAASVLYIVMEYVPGATLRRLLQDRGALPLPQALSVADSLTQALGYAHTQGIVHRDVKPDNIIIRDDGVLKVADFGIAKPLAPGATPLTSSGSLLGTPCYMAPEQVRAQPVDGRSDLFALGAVLYEALTGEKAFSANELSAVLRSVLEEDPPPPRALDPAIPEAVSDAVMRALEKDPARRFADALQMRQALLAGAAAVVPLAPRPAAARPAPMTSDEQRIPTRRPGELPPPPRAERVPLVGVIAVAIGVLLFLAALLALATLFVVPEPAPRAPTPARPAPARRRTAAYASVATSGPSSSARQPSTISISASRPS